MKNPISYSFCSARLVGCCCDALEGLRGLERKGGDEVIVVGVTQLGRRDRAVIVEREDVHVAIEIGRGNEVAP